jgi:hypothetical protein
MTGLEIPVWCGPIHSGSVAMGEVSGVGNSTERTAPPLKALVALFADHPRSVGESYFEHMQVAFAFGSRMLGAGFACLMHGLFPFLFVTTGSTTVRHLHDAMITHRSRARAAPEWIDHGAFI